MMKMFSLPLDLLNAQPQAPAAATEAGACGWAFNMRL
jgi:hypothetical protein